MKSVPEQLDDKKVNRFIFCFVLFNFLLIDFCFIKDDIHKVLEEFTMLDEFYYNLSNEDFAMKYKIKI